MKTLVVGGTGFAGGHAALYLRDQGYDVTVMSRSRPKGTSALNELPFVQGDSSTMTLPTAAWKVMSAWYFALVSM